MVAKNVRVIDGFNAIEQKSFGVGCQSRDQENAARKRMLPSLKAYRRRMGGGVERYDLYHKTQGVQQPLRHSARHTLKAYSP